MEKCIFKVGTAKRLLELGNKIIRLDYDKRDKKRAVFVFEGTNKLYSDLKLIEGNYY